MLARRAVNSKLGEASIRRFPTKGTPQGGVLSPLLWNLTLNELLRRLDNEGIPVIAYADDVALAISGKFLDSIASLMDRALRAVERWASSSGLVANPQKTVLVLFTNRRKIPVVN